MLDIISLDDVPQRLSQGPLARPFAVLTFDDGYRDNIEYAAPVLRDLGAPWTLYVVDEFANGRGSLWWLDLERAISTSEELSVSFDDGVQKYLTRTVRQKHTAFRAIHRRLKAGPEHSYTARWTNCGAIWVSTRKNACANIVRIGVS